MNGKFIVISRPDFFQGEAELINQLMALGDFTFHLRKKEAALHDLKKLIIKISTDFYSRIIIHQQYDLAEKFNLKGIHLPESIRKNEPPMDFHSCKIVSTSLHVLEDYVNLKDFYNYVFYSPVFKSISKSEYLPSLSEVELKQKLSKLNPDNLIALGGIEKDNLNRALQMGFNGVALLGSVWQAKSPVSYCKEVLAELKM